MTESDLDFDEWREAVEFALRSFMADVDYDIHKGIECGESDGENRYPEYVTAFMENLNYFLSK